MTTMRMISVTVLLLVGMALADACCPSGFSEYRKKCFKFFLEGKDWIQAELHCQSLGGNLASVHSPAEYRFVQGVIRRRAPAEPVAWIGGSNAVQERTWLWSDGSRFDWANWYQGEPNNVGGNEHCLMMNFSVPKQWNDDRCTLPFSYVCGKRC